MIAVMIGHLIHTGRLLRWPGSGVIGQDAEHHHPQDEGAGNREPEGRRGARDHGGQPGAHHTIAHSRRGDGRHDGDAAVLVQPAHRVHKQEEEIHPQHGGHIDRPARARVMEVNGIGSDSTMAFHLGCLT